MTEEPDVDEAHHAPPSAGGNGPLNLPVVGSIDGAVVLVSGRATAPDASATDGVASRGLLGPAPGSRPWPALADSRLEGPGRGRVHVERHDRVEVPQAVPDVLVDEEERHAGVGEVGRDALRERPASDVRERGVQVARQDLRRCRPRAARGCPG